MTLPFDPVGPDCTGEQPGMEALQEWMVDRFTLADSGTYVCKFIEGTNKRSFHAEGRAGDLSGYPDRMAPAAAFLLERAADLGVQEIIYDARIWRSTYEPSEWREFTGSDPHTSHIHYALTRAAAARSREEMLAIAEGDTMPTADEIRQIVREELEAADKRRKREIRDTTGQNGWYAGLIEIARRGAAKALKSGE